MSGIFDIFDVMLKQNHRTVVMFMVLLNEALFIADDTAVTPTPTPTLMPLGIVPLIWVSVFVPVSVNAPLVRLDFLLQHYLVLVLLLQKLFEFVIFDN